MPWLEPETLHYSIERGIDRLAQSQEFINWASDWMLNPRRLWRDLHHVAKRHGTTVKIVLHTIKYLYGSWPVKYGDYANMEQL